MLQNECLTRRKKAKRPPRPPGDAPPDRDREEEQKAGRGIVGIRFRDSPILFINAARCSSFSSSPVDGGRRTVAERSGNLGQ